MFLWCHQCKQKHDDVVYCSRYFKGSCSKKYCVGCIQRHYGEDINDDNKESWVCLYCRNLCSCAFCRRRRGDESVPPSEFGVSTVPRKAQKRKHHEIDEIDEIKVWKANAKRTFKIAGLKLIFLGYFRSN